MFTKKFAAGMAVCLLAGCTSFRTTALYRFDNDSVAPECNKLKGLPVKLKVPSHVRVVVYEQQLLLANSPTDQQGLDTKVTEAAVSLKTAQESLDGLDSAVADAKDELALAEQEQLDSSNKLKEANDSANDSDKPARIRAAETWQTAAVKRVAAAHSAISTANENTQNRAAFELAVKNAKAKLAVATEAATVGYTLISFTPQQLVVETELEYTDKIFLVDFRRPAGGILDLKEASMDDEQYFAKIQAEVTERTLADVSTAIKTLEGPLTPKKSTTNVATPTTANTPDGETADDVSFQKSVVAVKRFDISEPGWEDQMMAFVNGKLCSGGVPEVFQNPGYGSADNEATFEESSALVEMSPIPDASRTAPSNY